MLVKKEKKSTSVDVDVDVETIFLLSQLNFWSLIFQQLMPHRNS